MFSQIINEITKEKLEVYGIEIMQKGELIFSHYFYDNKAYPIYSATKSFVSTTFSLAVQENKIDYDSKIYEFLPHKYLQLIPNSQKNNFKQLNMKRFLTMSVAGLPFRPSGSDWLENILSLPIDYSKAPTFSYSNIPAYLVGVACENAVGKHLIDYLTPRLFKPLGIKNPTFQNCPQGHFYGATGMELTINELSRLGQLYLSNGTFNGKKILDEKYIKKATSKQIDNLEGGYGFYFWITENCFRISGKWGQKCLVYPEKDLIITYLSNLPESADKMLNIAENIAKML